jgi:hypothetical protein
VKRQVASVVLGALVLLSAASPAAAVQSDFTGLGIRLLEAPTERRDDPRAQVYIVDHVGPGTSFSRRFEVVNDSDEPTDVALYAVASEVRNGSFEPQAGRTANELATWMTVEPSSVRLAPGGSAQAVVSIAVPADASPGERYAAIMAESTAPDASTGIAVNSRVGIRTYLAVGPGGEPASDFVVDSLTAARDEQGQPVVRAEVRNTGGRALDMSGTLSLMDGPGGLSAGPFPAELGTTLGIGQSSPVTVVLDEALPAGPWKARIALKSGLLERAAEATITFPEAAGEVGPPVVATPLPLAEDPNVVIPVAVGLLGLASLLLLGFLLRRRTTGFTGAGSPTTGDSHVPQTRQSDDETVRR